MSTTQFVFSLISGNRPPRHPVGHRKGPMTNERANYLTLLSVAASQANEATMSYRRVTSVGLMRPGSKMTMHDRQTCPGGRWIAGRMRLPGYRLESASIRNWMARMWIKVWDVERPILEHHPVQDSSRYDKPAIRISHPSRYHGRRVG